MPTQQPSIRVLAERLIEEVTRYGLLPVSIPQYRKVCNHIVEFYEQLGEESYCAATTNDYLHYLEDQVSSGLICKDYKRFQIRVVRMLSSLANDGQVDFSSASVKSKYEVSEATENLISEILRESHTSEKTNKDLRGPIRHFFWYATQQGLDSESISDSFVMEFILNVVPITNGGSTGRTLRCIKLITVYLKNHGNCHLERDYTQLTIKNNHRRIIPSYTTAELCAVIDSADKEDATSKRNRAMIMLAYCTGLRGIDIVNIKLTDIDWRNQKLSVVQSKTNTPIIAELNGETLNALADYVLDWRPECATDKVFVTAVAPYRGLKSKLAKMLDKYCQEAGVKKIPFRSFHSIRRSFETELVSQGVPIETASQMLGHKTISEDKPYITYNKDQVSFVALDFSDVPITAGIYRNLESSFGKGDVK